jgi:diguanylate cyclase (GGDEF)-like protein/PAS domain S-box-containing protein
MAAGLDDNRLRVLESTHLMDSEPEAGFDRLTRLAADLLGAPVALVSLVDDRRQFFKSALGLAEPWASRRETPLSHSFCQFVARDRTELIVSDAREHPLLRNNLAIPDLGAIAYAGIPLVVDAETIGAFCVIDDKPREWTADKVQILKDLAASVVSEIQLRMALLAARQARSVTDAVVESIGDACIAIDPTRKFIIVNQAARRVFDEGADVGNYVPENWSGLHRSQRPDGSLMPSEDGALGRALRGLDTNGLTFTLQRPGAAEPTWVEVCGRPVRDGEGQVIAAVAVYRDVSEKKRQVDFYAALAGHIPRGAVGLFDHDLRCLAMDGGMLRADGVAPQDLIGRTMRQLAGFAPEDPGFDRIDDIYRRALAGESLSVDFESDERILALHVAPVRDSFGKVTTGIVLAMDVTQERRMEAESRRTEQINRAIVQHLPNGAVFVVDRELRYVSADGPLLPEILRRSDMKGLIGRRVADLVSPENRDALLDRYSRALNGERSDFEVARDGRFFDMSVVPIFEGFKISHALVSAYDVTDRRREAVELRFARDSLAREQALLQTTLAHIEDGVALIDAESRILLANQAFAAMLGLPLDSVIGMTREGFIQQLSPLLAEPAGFAESLSAQPPEVRQEFAFVRPRRRIFSRRWTPVSLVGTDGMLVTWHDVTAEKDLQREREQLLLVDELTGIPNRRAGDNALHTEHQRMKRSGTPLCVALLDIDHFKQVNDVFGHAAGDEVLRIVAGTLAGEARLTDTVARWGGEEFLAVLNVPLEGARTFCERARHAIEKLRCAPVERVTISAGIAEVAVGESLPDALERADRRLYEAKKSGRNRVTA